MLLKELRRFFSGLSKVFVALRYHFFARHQQIKRFQQKTWVRLAVLAVAALFVFRNEWGLSLGLPAASNSAMTAPSNGEKLSVAQPVALGPERAAHRSATLRQLDDAQVQAYVKRFARIARLEAQRYGIPASILMAQALSESWAGTHPASQQFNNHFGAPFSGKSYASAWENWREHSMFIARKHPEMLRYSKDYGKWAKALQQSGYSTQKRYARTLTSIIDKYHLYTLDQ